MFLTGYLHANVALQWMYSNQKRLQGPTAQCTTGNHRAQVGGVLMG